MLLEVLKRELGPWTQTERAAAEAYIAELDGLTGTEKTFLSGSIDDIIRDTPRTETAIVRIKKLLPKAGREGAEVLRRLLLGMATEAAKRLLSGT